MQRRALGIISLILVIAGGLGTFTEVFGDESHVLWGVALRTGLVLGAFWLVLPKARSVSPAIWTGIGVFSGVLALRPRLVLFGLVGAFVATVVVAVSRKRAAGS